MPKTKAALRSYINAAVADFLAAGGTITVLPARVAHGASFSRNQSPAFR